MATNRELKDQLDRQAAEIGKQNERIRMLEQAQKINETFAQTVNNLVHIVFGDGKEVGIAEDVRNTKNAVTNIGTKLDNYIAKGEQIKEERQKEEQDNRRWLRRTIIQASIATVISTSLPLLINAYLIWLQIKQP